MRENEFMRKLLIGLIVNQLRKYLKIEKSKKWANFLRPHGICLRFFIHVIEGVL